MTRGTIQNKEKFLTRIADQLGKKRVTEKVELPKWKKIPQYQVFKGFNQDQLMEEFVEQCKDIHTSVKVTTRENLQETFHSAITELGGKSIIHWGDERFSNFG